MVLGWTWQILLVLLLYAGSLEAHSELFQDLIPSIPCCSLELEAKFRRPYFTYLTVDF